MTKTQTAIIEILLEIMGEELSGVELSPATELLGETRIITSVALVELCIKLEDIALDAGSEFDWVSESAMSRGRSIFRTIESLAAEFDLQVGSAR